MAKRDYSKFQQGVIRRYYENREQIDEGKLSELVTSLYLAESKSARDKLWDRVESLLERLEVLPSRLEHVLASRDAAVLAELVSDLQKGLGRKGSG
jgi:hypothetical protein